MADPTETMPGNTEVTPVNTEAAAPGIPFAVAKRSTKPGTPREKTLDIPITTIQRTPYPSSTPINMNIFSPGRDIGSPKYSLSGSSKKGFSEVF